MDDRVDKTATVEELLRFITGIDFDLRQIACGMLFELQAAEKKLADDHPASLIVTRARQNAEVLLSLETKLHFQLREMLPPKRM